MKFLNVLKKVKNGFKRFPEVGIVSFLFVIVSVFLNHDIEFTDKILEKLLLTLLIGIIPFSYGKLLAERFEKWRVRILSNFLVIISLIFLYFNIPDTFNDTFMFRYIVLFLISLLLLILIYFYDSENISIVILYLINNFAITVLFSITIFLGISASIFSVDKLFELKINTDIYFDLYISVIGLFTINYFFNKFPTKEYNYKKFKYPVVFKKLFFYIIIPLISIYTIILYLYFLKLFILKKFPINLLSHLVMWYGFLSVLVLFFINKIKNQNKFIRYFYKYFPIVIIGPIVMLFLAIGRRINNFGITPQRYFVVILGIWITISMFCIFYCKKRKQISVIISSLVLLMLTIYGPQNAFNISKTSQINRFKKVLIENNMLKNGKIIKNTNLNLKQKKKISEFIYYFEDNYKYSEIDILPKNFSKDNMKKYFGFNYVSKYRKRNNIIRFYSNNFNSNKLFIIKNYDYFIEMDLKLKKSVKFKNNNFRIEYISERKELHILKNNKLLIKISVFDLIEKIQEKNSNRNIDSLKNATINVNNKDLNLRFIINNIYYRKGKKEGVLKFKLFINLK